MKYYIQRQLNEYGPYTLADLQRYVAQGSIQLSDLARSEGMTEWVPVSQVLGNIPIPVPGPSVPAVPTYGGGAYGGSGTVYNAPGTVYNAPSPVYSAPGAVYNPAAAQPVPGQGPMPVDFHWAAVLVLSIVTCGLFAWAWLFVQAAYVRRIKPDSKAMLFAVLAFGSAFFSGFINSLSRAMTGVPISFEGLFGLAGLVLLVITFFQIKDDLESYYNTVEPIGLRLNIAMTFFFGVWYFQHHFSRIAQWKKTGVLQPQG
jgi:hypothetical protein